MATLRSLDHHTSPSILCGMPASQLDYADQGAVEALLHAIHTTDDAYYTSSLFDRLFEQHM